MYGCEYSPADLFFFQPSLDAMSPEREFRTSSPLVCLVALAALVLTAILCFSAGRFSERKNFMVVGTWRREWLEMTDGRPVRHPSLKKIESSRVSQLYAGERAPTQEYGTCTCRNAYMSRSTLHV